MQLTQQQVADTLVQQDALGGDAAATPCPHGCRTVASTSPTAAPRRSTVPVTGTTAGYAYAGQRSGWITVAPGTEQVLAPAIRRRRPGRGVRDGKVGEKLTATGGTWTGTPDDLRAVPVAAL